MLDIDKELDIHFHATHESVIDRWTIVADCEDKSCCLTSDLNTTGIKDLSRYISGWLNEWIKEMIIEQLDKRRTYLSAQLREIDERISEVSE